MKRITLAFTAALFIIGGAIAHADPFDQFRSYLSSQFLDPFAKDLGAVLGGGSLHTGEALGFPGVDIGIHTPIKRVDGKDDIANAAGVKYLAIPWLQAEIGLPLNTGLFIRGMTAYGTKVIGGGLSYSVFKSKIPGMPELSVSWTYNHLDHTYLTARTWSLNTALSLNIPIVTPFVAGGYDRTNVSPKDAAFTGPGASVAKGVEGNSSGYRVEGGVNIGFLPLSYLTLAAGAANGEMLYHAGLGVRF